MTDLGVRRFLVAAVLVLQTVTPSWGQSPLVAELKDFATRYHEDPPRLDTLREGLAEAVKTDPRAENLLALAQVCLIWGDIRATTRGQKLEAYTQGREAAKRALELDPKSAAAHFWYGANTGRWGQAKGMVRSLFLLRTLQEEIRIILALDPKFTAVYLLAGNLFYEVPELLGGDPDKAEQMFRKGLELDPKYTGMRVGLAKTLIKKGRIAEAKGELEAVLRETEPRNRADWTVGDSEEARELLELIKGKSGRQNQLRDE